MQQLIDSVTYATFRLTSMIGINTAYYTYFDPSTRVCDGVYIGSLATGSCPAAYADSGIGMIINLSGRHYESAVPVHEVALDDAEITPDNVRAYCSKFMEIARLISAARARGESVLVHCMAGVNRAPTAIGFYMLVHGVPLQTVLLLLRDANTTRRVSLLTNASFRRFLAATYRSMCTRMNQR